MSFRSVTPRLGRIPYLNTEPFFGDDQVRASAVAEVPRRMIELALAGAVDIAPLPAVAQFDHPRAFRPVGEMGIATRSDARSVLLLSRVPIDRLGGRPIGVIDDTATSVRLLKVLLHLRYDVTAFRLQSLDLDGDAMLLIGDRALQARSERLEFPHVVDLAAAWHEWTALPFVFAFWMARREVGPAETEEAVAYLEESLERNRHDLGALGERHAELGLSPAEAAGYLRKFEYRFTPQVWDGLERFRELDGRVTALENAA